MNIAKMHKWNAPESWQKITCIDAHTAGEPLRIITGGFPALKGKSILEQRQFTRENFDHLRKALMWEPRGHADMYGCLITDAVSPDADFGVLFIHNEGFSTMCGHGIIAIATVAVETGLIAMHEPETKILIDTPAGLVTAFARIKNNHVYSVYFQNVASFVHAYDQQIKIPGLGTIRCDIAFGGAYYAFVQAEELGIRCTAAYFRQMIDLGMRIKHAVMDDTIFSHPFEEDLNFLYGTIFIAPPESKDAQSRNVCVFAEGEVDRSPTGTGVSARMALHHFRGEIEPGESMIIESIIGTRFRGSVLKTTQFGPYAAVIPEVEGSAFITGKSEFLIDPDDPLKYGFILR
jgi:proline racemase